MVGSPCYAELRVEKAVWQIPENVYRRNLEMAIELLDLKDLLKTFARELSLGQRMRADIA